MNFWFIDFYFFKILLTVKNAQQEQNVLLQNAYGYFSGLKNDCIL